MKAAVLTAPHELAIAEHQVPEVGEKGVLIRVRATGVCGSDLHTYRGRHPFRKPPVVLGHEAAGEVIQVGPAASGVRVGDRVTVEPQESCGRCNLCQSGEYNLCPEKRVPGTRGWVGSFAEYFWAPADRVYPIPDGLDWDVAALAEPLAVGLHAARVAQVGPGDRVAILGAGSIGLSALLAARLLGADRVAATDIAPRKLALVEALGGAPVDARSDPVSGAVRALGCQADAVVVTAEYPGMLTDAVRIVAPRGRVSVVSLFEDAARWDPNPLVIGERYLCGSMVYTRTDYDAVLSALAQGSMRPQTLITHRLPLEEAPRALAMLDQGEGGPVKIMLLPVE